MTEDFPPSDSMELEESLVEIEEKGEYFNDGRTTTLIELYKKYRPMVAMGSIKTMKQMWEIISVDLTNIYQISIAPSKCENRFKVLERSYKKIKEIIESGQQPARLFPYYEEFTTLPRNKKYAIVPGLNPSNYSEYTTVNFNNTVTPVSSPSITYVELSNMKQDLTEQMEEIPQTENVTQIKEDQSNLGSETYFNKERTLALLDLYKKYNQKYRERSIKTKRRMWYLVAKEMIHYFNIPITGAKCENKLKVLERSYKRGVHFKRRYEFESELKEIFGDKVSKPIIKPEVKGPTLLNNANAPSTSATPQQVTIRLLDPKTAVTDKIESVLLNIRSDFQIYYRERLNLEREKLSLKRQKLIFLKEKAAMKQNKKNAK